MMRWAGVAICLAGFLVLTAAVAAERPENRNTIGNHGASSIDRTKSARLASAVKLHRPAVRQKNPKIADPKIVKQKAARHAKTRHSRLSVFNAGNPIPKGGGINHLGVPYVIGGQTYTPQSDPNYRAEGKASWYGGSFHGRRTANGERFDMAALSAAHPTLPLPSYVRVINLENHRSIIVRLNDRGPYHGQRLIDVSVRAAKLLGFYDQGLAQVRVEYMGRAELDGSDNDALAATLRYDEQPAVQVAAAPPAPPARPEGSKVSEVSPPSPDVRGPMLSTASLRLQAYDPDFPTDGRIRWY